MRIPELRLPSAVLESLQALAARQSLEQIEARALDPEGRRGLAAELASPDWEVFVAELSRAWRAHDHAVVRALPCVDGSATILVALALRAPFKPYRGDKIVKHFKMSPWTTELSQTLGEGHFHTDLSTASAPPRVTLIHCREPDPSEGQGAVRVARLVDLLAALRERGADEILRFLLEDEVEMVDERARGSWTGVMARAEAIRFHPETLRAAKARNSSPSDTLERQLAGLREAALSVSTPIPLGRGDALFVSNTRALHYRGACTVRYVEFPRRFEAREIHVLHLRDEPQWPE